MEPDLLPPAPSPSFYDDCAADVIEQAVGRYRWRENWKAMVASEKAMPAIRQWIAINKLDADPEKILSAIEDLMANAGDKWV